MSGKNSKAVRDKGSASTTIGLPALLLLALTSACGGGGARSELEPGPTSVPPVTTLQEQIVEPSTPTTDIPPLATGPMHAFLNIEERSGKRVLDAWFVAAPVGFENVPEASNPMNSLTPDHCQPVATSDGPILFSGPSARAADAIELVSRSGVQARLDYYISPNAVVYAPEQRWLREPIADDTQVKLVGNAHLQSLTSPMLSAVKSLDINQPRRPILGSASTPIDWEPSKHPDDQIVLTIWPKNRSTINAEQPTLVCKLADDGRFILAESTASTTLTDSAYGFRLRRERRSEHQADGMVWSIVQSSLAVF